MYVNFCTRTLEAQHESVDDGKSTLIGRLLYDSKQVFEDTMASLERASTAQGLEQVNLALLTDGLRAEREQGITIDVAYRYFATPRRKFIIADSPGHVQYTRNMVTGASTAQLALILVDARKGVVEQTRRHSALTSLLGIRHLVLCVNKMDLVGWDRGVYDRIVDPTATIEIRDVIAEGEYYGMQTFDQALVKLVQVGLVTEDEARRASTNPHDFVLALRGTMVRTVPAGIS